MSNLSAIRDIGNNDYTLNELVTQLRSSLGVLPFVGAGLSIPFGFKGWKEFLLAKAQTSELRKKISDRVAKGQYEEAAQDLLESLGDLDFRDALSMEFGEQKLKAVSVKGAVSYLPRLSSGPVITTNFDRVLETVFEGSGARFEERIWGGRVQMAQKAVIQNKRYLLKLHGDVEDSVDRILTLKEYDNHYGTANDPSTIDFNKPLPRLLQMLLTNRPVLFLGCSLHQDRTVDFIRALGGSAAGLLHYAVLEHPGNDADFVTKNQMFSAYGIRRIWYPKGEHKYVERIMEYLSAAISNPTLSTVMRPKKTTLMTGMQAPEAFETVIRKHPQIDTVTLVRYKDKLRLPERTTVKAADDPATFITEAAVHDNKADQEESVPATDLGNAFWKQRFESLGDEFVLAASSKVKLKDGTLAHLPMIDFKCAPTQQNVDMAYDAFKKIGRTDGVLLNSGNSFHYYGETLMNETEWRAFLGHCLLLSDFIDTRYVGHALINNDCRLRLSTTPLNPFIPTVVKVF